MNYNWCITITDYFIKPLGIGQCNLNIFKLRLVEDFPYIFFFFLFLIKVFALNTDMNYTFVVLFSLPRINKF